MRWARLRSFRTLPDAHLALNELVHAGFGAEVRGESRLSLIGELPFPDARVEVWVLAEQHAAATSLLAEVDARAEGASRRCPACGEDNPPSFELCWRCGGPVG